MCRVPDWQNAMVADQQCGTPRIELVGSSASARDMGSTPDSSFRRMSVAILLTVALTVCGPALNSADARRHQGGRSSGATTERADWAITLQPSSGPVGTRVKVMGSGFDPALYSAPLVPLTLNRTFADGCSLVGGVHEVHLNVTRAGKLRGHFVITAHGSCFQQPGRRHAVTPGVYQIAIGCMACNVHGFRVTS
jgi:hypothetical protein